MSKKASNTPQVISKSFIKELTQALKKFNKPAWLGENISLAAPYFLGEHLFDQPDIDLTDPVVRGKTLQNLLREAANELAEQNEEWSQLLHMRFLNVTPRSVQRTIMELNIAKATYARQKNKAIEQLAQKLISRLKPTLRLEVPAPVRHMTGRDEIKNACLTGLRQGRTIGLVGPSGIGKTTLGIALAHQFAPNATFWVTFYPGLNDRLSSLLFMLGYFLYQQGASSLWQQLVVVADQGELETTLALNLLRSDLAKLRDTPLVLCFDEVDLLRPAEIESHAQIMPFLDNLRSLTPLIFIGQKGVIEADQIYQVTGLTTEDTKQLLDRENLNLTQKEVAALQRYTQGNPRLLELSIALYQVLLRVGVSSSEALSRLAIDHSLELLLRRIWRHLNEAEMYLLEVLAIFRRPAPRAAWLDQTEQAAITQLIDWHLIQLDSQSGISLLPIYKEAISKSFSAEEKEASHLAAATIRARYGQYTSAAYHCLAGGKPQLTVRLWQAYKEQEIDQGQAEVGLSLLQSISPDRLGTTDRETLLILRAELHKLLGNYEQAQKTLQSVLWHTPFLKVMAKRMEGDIAELQGAVSQAVKAYQEGSKMVERWLSESANFRRALGYLYVHQRDFEQAQLEALRIQYDAANLMGYIQERKGDLEKAQNSYLEAITFAKKAHYDYGEANAQSNLGHLLAWQRESEQAEALLEKAAQFFERTSRLNKLASVSQNLAFAYYLAEQYRAAIAPAEKALALFEQLGEPFGKASSAGILAEAHLALDNLAEAERYAERVIAEEEPMTQPDGLRTLGEIRLKQKQCQEAEQLIEQSIKIAQDNQDKILEAYGWRALGKVKLTREEIDTANIVLKRAKEIFDQSALPEEVARTEQIWVERTNNKNDESPESEAIVINRLSGHLET